MSELQQAITDMFPEVSACEDNDKRYSTHELMALAPPVCVDTAWCGRQSGKPTGLDENGDAL